MSIAQSSPASDSTVRLPRDLSIEIPDGLCQCGCGQRTKINDYNCNPNGYVKGEYRSFVRHHHYYARDGWLEEDRGYKTPCWIWQGSKQVDGYGMRRAAPGSRARTAAHRAVYAMFRGEIQPGLVLDHLCRVPSCVNPDHLEPVTPAENTRRGQKAGLGLHGAFAARWLRFSTTLSLQQIGDILGVKGDTIRHCVHGDTHTADGQHCSRCRALEREVRILRKKVEHLSEEVRLAAPRYL